MARTPYVEQEACICCNLCVDTLPAVFRLTEDGLAEVHDPAGASEQEIQACMDACPVACIVWR